MAKTETLDGTVPNAGPVVIYDVPDLDADLEIDFLDGSDLEQVEEGIRKIQVTSDLLALVQGVAIVKVEQEGLWRQGGYDNLRAYRIDQLERLGIPKQTLSRRRAVAEGYLNNRKMLGKMSLAGHVEKLAYLDEALRKYERRDILAHFKADSIRAFIAWVRPRIPSPELPDVDMRVRGDRVLLDGEPCLAFDPELAPEERDFVSKTLAAAYRARRGNCLAHVVAVYDQGEAQAVERFLKKLRAGK